MKETIQSHKKILFLLGIPLFLWILALLFLFRVVNIFDRVLMKLLGPVVIYAAMSICPLIALILGVKMIRRKESPRMGWFAVGGGGVLLAAFVGVIGVSMVKELLTPDTPKNPSTPRILEPQVGLPVFPGAEGFGTRTPAGRGGKIIEVTSLADSGPGTLRAALEDPSPRIIVFRVGGTIEVQEALYISHPYVTVAGQTAPGDGICIKGIGLIIATHDVLVQHIRVRPGNEANIDAENNDAISIFGPHANMDGAYNVVLDHISASWGEDETVSTWYGAHDITISWSIISEALDESRHRKATHSAGVLFGDSTYNVSLHHTLMAHNDFRNPLIIDGGTHDIVYNVVYNWGVLPAEIVDTDSNSFLNFVGNTFIPGPSTQLGNYEILISPTDGFPQLYVLDNIGPHRPDNKMDEWSIVAYGWGDVSTAPDRYRSLTRFPTPPITAMSAGEAFELVLKDAGASLPRRDAVDSRVVSSVRDGTGWIIDSPEEVGGYPIYVNGTPPADSDHDGMPDGWEAQMGLDPDDPSDGNEDIDGDGHTNIEEYLHSLSK